MEYKEKMDYKKRFLLNDLVKGRRTFNNEVVEGRFNGFHLYNKLDPTSVVGVICVEGDRCYDIVAESIELLESEDERIRKAIIEALKQLDREKCPVDTYPYLDWIAWLEKQGEQEQTEHPNGEDYGIDSLYHAARILEKTLGEVDGYQSDDGILEHKCAIEAVKRLYEQKPAWCEEDENGLNDALWAIQKARTIAKDENDMGNLWCAENWLKSIKEWMKGE